MDIAEGPEPGNYAAFNVRSHGGGYVTRLNQLPPWAETQGRSWMPHRRPGMRQPLYYDWKRQQVVFRDENGKAKGKGKGRPIRWEPKKSKEQEPVESFGRRFGARGDVDDGGRAGGRGFY